MCVCVCVCWGGGLVDLRPPSPLIWYVIAKTCSKGRSSQMTLVIRLLIVLSVLM